MKHNIVWLGPDCCDIRLNEVYGGCDISPNNTVDEICMILATVPGLIPLLNATGCSNPDYDPRITGGKYIFDANDMMRRKYAILQPVAKQLSDLCPRCYIRGVWGPRAVLLCPSCRYIIGGLG